MGTMVWVGKAGPYGLIGALSTFSLLLVNCLDNADRLPALNGEYADTSTVRCTMIDGPQNVFFEESRLHIEDSGYRFDRTEYHLPDPLYSHAEGKVRTHGDTIGFYVQHDKETGRWREYTYSWDGDLLLLETTCTPAGDLCLRAFDTFFTSACSYRSTVKFRKTRGEAD